MDEKRKNLIMDILADLGKSNDSMIIGKAINLYYKGLYKSNEPITRKRALEFLVEYLSTKTVNELTVISGVGL